MFLRLQSLFLAVLVVTSLSLIPSADTVTTGTKDPKILILGAGISGVTAAKILNRLGYTNFQIIEGAGKVGGRVAFLIDQGGYTVELGAVFVNGAEMNPLFPLLQKHNLSWVRPDPDGWSVRDTDGSDVTNLADLIYEKRFQFAKDRVETIAEKARA